MKIKHDLVVMQRDELDDLLERVLKKILLLRIDQYGGPSIDERDVRLKEIEDIILKELKDG